jgi:hypothetical protein
MTDKSVVMQVDTFNNTFRFSGGDGFNTDDGDGNEDDGNDGPLAFVSACASSTSDV